MPLPTARQADPAGTLTALQAFPTGGAVSPDSKTLMVIAGAPLQGGSPVSLPGPQLAGVAIDVFDTTTGALRQAVEVSAAFQSIVFSPDGSRAYIAGGTDGVVHVLSVGATGLSPTAGTWSSAADINVGSFVAGLALTRDGSALYASEPNANTVARIDVAASTTTRTWSVQSPDQLVLSADGATLYASDWRGEQVAAISVNAPLNAPLSGGVGGVFIIPSGRNPEGLALAVDGHVLVADSGDATLSAIAPTTGAVARTDLKQIGEGNDGPGSIAVAPGGRAYVALAADNAIAVLDPPAGASPSATTRPQWRLRGLIPTAWYPVAVTLNPSGSTLYVVTGRGLAHSAAATAPYVPLDPAAVGPDSAYATVGALETIPVPSDSDLDAYTTRARSVLADQLPPGARNRVVADAGQNPVLAGPAGPIKHVIYITRENKTYDADLGDLHPGPGNALTLFGETVTPNLHALERTFSEAQNFTYEGFASSVGHMWEDAGVTSDLFERAIASDVGVHFSHVSTSWSDPVNYPPGGLLTEQAHRAGLSVRTYNEELAQQSHLLPDVVQAPQSVFPNYNLHYPDVGREAGWWSEFHQFESHSCTGALAATYGANCSLPALEYVYLGEDHTTVYDQPGYPTIEAQVADNDAATGRVIDAVSHSHDWRSTLVIVVEDDPQGTGDHESAYHGFVALASPYVRRHYISTVPYDLTSVVGAIDAILGLPPLSDFAATNRPLDDLFTGTPAASAFAPFRATDTGISAYPFTPLPGIAPSNDPAHGIYSFTTPDATDPGIAGAATWRQVKGD